MRGKSPIEACDGGVLIRVRVQPKASADAIHVTPDGAIAVRLTAPPIDGAANQALCAFLAKWFRVPKRAVELRHGERSRDKTVLIHGITESAVRKDLGVL